MFTVLTLKNKQINCIVDNLKTKDVQIYNMDMMTDSIQADFKNSAVKWFYENSTDYSLSYYFAINNLTTTYQPYYKTVELRDIENFDGKIFKYKISEKPRVRRKKVLLIDDMKIINRF